MTASIVKFIPILLIGDLAHMVERLLRMREALGSIPRISSLFFLIQTRLLNEMAILLVYRVVVCLFLIIFLSLSRILFFYTSCLFSQRVVWAKSTVESIAGIDDSPVAATAHRQTWVHVSWQDRVPVGDGRLRFGAKLE